LTTSPDLHQVEFSGDAGAWRTIVKSGPRPFRDAPIRLRRIIVQITVAIVVVVALVAVAGALVSRNSAEREAVHEAAILADVLATSVLQPALTTQNATDPTTIPAAIDAIVRTRILSTSVARVKLWTPQGEIVYSDESRLIGQNFTLDDGARDVLADPQTRAEVSDLSKPENVYERSEGKLLEVYRPVWTPTGSPLLFETYFRYDVVSQRSSELWRGFAGITLSSVLAIFALLLPLMWALASRTRRAQAQREQLMERALDASQEERRRIAVGLHDGVVQQLVAASFEVSGGAEVARARGDLELSDRLGSAAARVRTGIGGLRSLLVDIYPPSLHDSGLGPALREMAASVVTGGPVLALSIDDQAAERLTPEQKEAFFRIAQEAARNAVQHASANHVSISLGFVGDVVALEIRDDGVGLPDPAAATSPEGHFGMTLMRDTAVQIGAGLELAVSGGSTGTGWRVTVPA
jgi:signal transduction histidine kinase